MGKSQDDSDTFERHKRQAIFAMLTQKSRALRRARSSCEERASRNLSALSNCFLRFQISVDVINIECAEPAVFAGICLGRPALSQHLNTETVSQRRGRLLNKTKKNIQNIQIGSQGIIAVIIRASRNAFQERRHWVVRQREKDTLR